MFKGIQSITRRLLDLPNGINFMKIAVLWFSEEDVKSTMDLVSRCVDTLQSLDIASHRSGMSRSLPPIPGVADRHMLTHPNRSTPLKYQRSTLREAVFRCGGLWAEWTTRALHTAESKNLQRLSLDLPRYFAIEDTVWEIIH